MTDVDVKSFTHRLEERKNAAIEYIKTDNFTVAMMALLEAAECKAVLDEYEFQREFGEFVEVNNA